MNLFSMFSPLCYSFFRIMNSNDWTMVKPFKGYNRTLMVDGHIKHDEMKFALASHLQTDESKLNTFKIKIKKGNEIIKCTAITYEKWNTCYNLSNMPPGGKEILYDSNFVKIMNTENYLMNKLC